MKCVELCNFHFCCAFIFCQSMKKFEFFGASRATRQRHFKTSSTGDENAGTRTSRRTGSKMTPESFTAHDQKLDVLRSCRLGFGFYRPFH